MVSGTVVSPQFAKERLVSCDRSPSQSGSSTRSLSSSTSEVTWDSSRIDSGSSVSPASDRSRSGFPVSRLSWINSDARKFSSAARPLPKALVIRPPPPREPAPGDPHAPAPTNLGAPTDNAWPFGYGAGPRTRFGGGRDVSHPTPRASV